MSRQQSNQRSDIYSHITNTIIADLKQGVRHNGQPYTGINVLLLWSQAISCGFASSRFLR